MLIIMPAQSAGLYMQTIYYCLKEHSFAYLFSNIIACIMHAVKLINYWIKTYGQVNNYMKFVKFMFLLNYYNITKYFYVLLQDLLFSFVSCSWLLLGSSMFFICSWD